MINTLFVDRAKIFRLIIIGAFAYVLFLLGGVWLAMFVDLAHNVSVISLIFVAIYIVMALKWAQSLVELYRLALQKEPYVTMTNEGITFIQPQGSVSIPWGRVIWVEIYSVNAIILQFVKCTKIPFRFPFGKLGENVVATISLCDKPMDEVYDLVMQYSDKFHKSDTGDVYIDNAYEPKIMDYLLFANGIVMLAIYYYTASIKTMALWFGFVLVIVIACSIMQNYYLQNHE